MRLLLSSCLLVLTAGKRFSCDQTVIPCACVPDDNGVYYDAKDCGYECCPTYNCDPVERKCKPDLSGGFPWASCVGSCNEQVLGYECNPATMQCQPSTSVTTTKEYCEAECGSQQESSVVLCTYYCGSGASQFVLQSCSANPAGSGTTPVCAGQPDSDAQAKDRRTVERNTTYAEHRSLTEADTECCKTNLICPNYRLGWPCCEQSDYWDGGQLMCHSSAPTPPPREPPTCPDGSNARFFNQYAMRGGLMQCMQFDCTWDAQLCGPADCMQPTLQGPACRSDSHIPVPKIARLSGQVQSDTVENTSRGPEQLASAHARTYMGLNVTAPNHDGRQVMHSFHWHGEDGKFFRLQYRALLTPKVIFSLEDEASVKAVKCKADGAVLIQAEPNAMEPIYTKLKAAHFLTGGHHWGCSFPALQRGGHAVRAIVRKVVKVIRDSSSSVIVLTTAAKYDEIFEHANMSFSTNYLPHVEQLHADSPHASNRERFAKHKEAEMQAAQEQGTKLANHRRKLFWGCLGNFFNKAWNGLKRIAQDVGAIVSGVAKAVEALLEGDYSYEKKWSIAAVQWNYDPATGSAQRKSIPLNDRTDCTECYINFEVSVNVDLEIKSYQLQHAAAYLEGDADVLIHASSRMQAGDDLSLDTLISTLKLPDVHFMVGPVPFVIQTTVPIHAGCELSATETMSSGGDIQARAQLTGQMKYGVQYTAVEGFQFINQHTLSHQGGLTGTHLELTAVANVYIMPVIVINIDHIGGPHVGFKGFAQTSVDFKSDHSLCSPTGGAGTSFTSAWGLQLTIGAQLDIEFAGHTFLKKSTDDEPIWSHQWPLAAGCLELQTNRDLADANGFVQSPSAQLLTDNMYDFFEGVQYVGDIAIKDDPECDKHVSVHGGLQFVNQSEHGYPGFVGISANNNVHTSSLHDYNVACVGQLYYIADGGALRHYIQPSLEPSVAYTNCSLNMLGKAGATLADLQGGWQFSSDLSSIILTPSNPCILPSTLYREKRASPRATTMTKCRASSPDIVWNGKIHHAEDIVNEPRLTANEATALLMNGTRPHVPSDKRLK